MKKKLDLSYVGTATIHKYGVYLRQPDDLASIESLETIIYNALKEGKADGEKEEYCGRVDVTVHIELLKDPVLFVEAE